MKAFHLEAEGGPRFCLLHLPEDSALMRGAVVHFHPFAEEMNRSRGLAARQARAFADAGYVVLQFDAFGCGDSAGGFEEASWSRWVDDGLLACRWVSRRYNAPLWLWGVRVGALLASEVAQHLDRPANLLFWQPVIRGAQGLQQFLRIRMAAELAAGGGKGVVERLKRQLESGESVEIAGYTVTPELAEGLGRSALLPPSRPARLEWIEFTAAADGALAPASTAELEKWGAAGHSVRARSIACPPFWQAAEPVDCPGLVAATCAALYGQAQQ